MGDILSLHQGRETTLANALVVKVNLYVSKVYSEIALTKMTMYNNYLSSSIACKDIEKMVNLFTIVHSNLRITFYTSDWMITF